MAVEMMVVMAGGYDQMIGKRFRNGVEWSGAEWQKPAIVRAYMWGAPVLDLDEPTAALERVLHNEIQDSLGA
jgi:ATP-binding cassette subfamily B protein